MTDVLDGADAADSEPSVVDDRLPVARPLIELQLDGRELLSASECDADATRRAPAAGSQRHPLASTHARPRVDPATHCLFTGSNRSRAFSGCGAVSSYIGVPHNFLCRHSIFSSMLPL